MMRLLQNLLLQNHTSQNEIINTTKQRIKLFELASRMETITSYLLKHPSTLIIVIPLFLLTFVIIYIVSFPAPRPFQSRRADKFHPSKVPPNLGEHMAFTTLLIISRVAGYKILCMFSRHNCHWIRFRRVNRRKLIGKEWTACINTRATFRNRWMHP